MHGNYLIAANWKMNTPPSGFDAPDSPYRTQTAVDVIVFPPFIDLHRCIDAKLIAGAQCGRPEAKGAFTGDVSMAILASIGCRSVLCGHSERRRFHGETDAFVMEQTIAALEAKLHPIVCIGETLEEREKGKQKDVVTKQVKGLPSGITIAYEPVWAIGNGKAATPSDAQEMHAWIRTHLSKEDQQTTRILYGGSMNAANAEAFLKQKDIDGGLIGAASLKPDDFGKMVEIAGRLSS